MIVKKINFSQLQSPFQWVDIFDPAESDLDHICSEFSVDRFAITECLDSEHLPKLENVGASQFLILRIYDKEILGQSQNLQELTRKVSIFWFQDKIITLHRANLPFLSTLGTYFQEHPSKRRSVSSGIKGWAGQADGPGDFIYHLISAVLDSYEEPIDMVTQEITNIEHAMFSRGNFSSNSIDMEDFYSLKQKASSIKRIVRLLQDIIAQISWTRDVSRKQQDHLKEWGASLQFHADGLLENIHTLIHIHLSLAAQRTNEVMRVLTIFSMFILPLNLITGIYGMNFQHMPELSWKWGYPFALALMFFSLGFIFSWFRKKGWLRWTPE